MASGVVAMARRKAKQVSRAKRVKRSARRRISQKGKISAPVRKAVQRVRKSTMRKTHQRVRRAHKVVHRPRRPGVKPQRKVVRKRALKVRAPRAHAKVAVKRTRALVRGGKVKSLAVRKPMPIVVQPPKGITVVLSQPLAPVTIGTVAHYYSHLSVGIIALTATLRIGDRIRIKGHTTDVTQTVESIQIDHQPVREAHPGQVIGIKVAGHVRDGDAVSKVV